jgi:DNA-binding response OmpR family regulator
VQSTSLAGRTILVVEDEFLIALDIVAALEGAGANVVAAATLDRATQLVELDKLSAAVLDFGLRGGDANGLCARLNEREVPYILHSGYTHLGDQCHRGVVVAKPANPSVLIDALLRLLGGPNGANPPALRPEGELRP